jgi:hypothetical protein
LGQEWRSTPKIPAEAQIRGSQSKAYLRKSMRPYLKSKLKAKGLRIGLKQ